MRVAGKPVLSYLLDDLADFHVNEIVFIVGHLGDSIRAFMAAEYPQIKAHFVVQEVQDGTAGAVALAEPYIDGELVILFADTIFEADLTIARALSPEKAGVIWTHEVEDYHKYGVVVTDADGNMRRIVEKPSEPLSRLANIGLYYIREHELLFEGVAHTLVAPPGPTGEYYLTDAFQYMVDAGAQLVTASVHGWYDTGSISTILEANRHMLSRGRAGSVRGAIVQDSEVEALARIEDAAQVRGSVIGDNVTIEAGAQVEGSELVDTIVGAGARVLGSQLCGSLVGCRAVVEGFTGSVSVADDSRLATTPVLAASEVVLTPEEARPPVAGAVAQAGNDAI